MPWKYQGMTDTQKQLATYVDEDVHRRFRVRAAQMGLSISGLLKRLVSVELEKEADDGK